VHIGARRTDLLDHPRERDLTVDQHLQVVPGPRRRRVVRPPTRRRPKRSASDPLQPTSVMATHTPRNPVAGRSVEPANHMLESHGSHPTATSFGNVDGATGSDRSA
jgi:hypothetical protein